ncbi:glycosyltransferase [Psychroserpens damuponensis]|uniref:glycosyltransferase n=1 Tax=Psychroserpens damuponensis TaxID=943936 RepID=UPI00058E6627|nr:glycosyltransferase [Psychroserpens damuponensis]
MESLYFSFIIPVYNRPDEVEELLNSFKNLEGDFLFEIVVIEDGSTVDCKSIIDKFSSKLDISYYFKPNSGPGDSRNYGMSKAKGNYFIILDSDCLLPAHYLKTVHAYLTSNYVDCFGGPDAAHESFTDLQKAINFAMTSFITTGGIRGGKISGDKFQPRSFNMGLSKKGFEASGGFGLIHPGEDPDLSIRLLNLGFKTVLIKEAYVYHKRRISWRKFYMQVYKFGMVRPILNTWHPTTRKLTYWFPTVFSLGFILAMVLLLFGWSIPICFYGIYITFAFILSLVENKSIRIAVQSILAIFIQFFGYGYGFFKSTLSIGILNRDPQNQYPNLFFKNVK